MTIAMWTNYYDPNEDKMYAFNLSVLPYITIPKETLRQMKDILEHDSVGMIYESVCDYIYEDKEPTLKTKAENSFFKTMIEQITRLSFPYFKKLSKLKNQGGAVQIISETKEQDTKPLMLHIETYDTEDRYELGFGS